MRVLRVELGDGVQVDLHPSVSVLPDLSDRERVGLRRALAAIGSGLDPGVAALVEVHGVLLDATQDDLDLLEVARHPVTGVMSIVDVPGVLDDAEADRLRTAARDVLLLATDRREACVALARADASAVRPTRAQQRARADSLRARIARHGTRRTEPVRAALDDVRDHRATGSAPPVGRLVEALGPIGIDVADLGLPPDEVVRIAEDWLDECRAEAAWVVGAGIELRGIDAALEAATGPVDGPEPDLGALRARADRASSAHAEAVDRLDALRTALAAPHRRLPPATELERHLLARLAEHRPARLAGAAPLLLDGLLGHLDGAEVAELLDRLASLAGGVQLVVVDPHPDAARWAGSAGVRRAAVIQPVREPSAVPSR